MTRGRTMRSLALWSAVAMAACSGASEALEASGGDGGASGGGADGGAPPAPTTEGPTLPGTSPDASVDGAVEGGPKPIVMPTCDPPAATPSFFTTLEDAPATETPAIGSGTGTRVGGTFVTGKCGGALALGGLGESVTYPASFDGGVNIRKAHGTMTFWWKAGGKYPDAGAGAPIGTLFESGTGLRFVGSYAEYKFSLLVYLDVGKYVRVISSANSTWFAGDWVHLRFDWDFESGGYMAIAVNGKSVGSESVVLGGAVGGIGSITLGTQDSAKRANGAFDEVRFFP